MKNVSIMLTCALIAFNIKPANAQTKGDNLTAISWEVSFPSGGDYITETSWSGGRIEFRHFIKPNISVGLGLSWNSFDEYVPSQTYKSGSTSVTTDMVRQIYTVPITALFHYYFDVSNKKIRPYVGVGLGTQYAEQNSYFNVYGLESNNWGFVARPEIGALIAVSQTGRIMIGGGYNYATNKNDDFNIKELKQFNVNLGFAWVF